MRRNLFLIILLFCFGYTLLAQSSSNSREFWVSYFGLNRDADIKDDPTLQEFFVLIASKNGCTGTVSNPISGYSESFTVAPGTVEKVYIPYNECYNHSDSDSVFVTNRGILVNTSDSATVYMGNYQQSSYDASAVFPVKSLGTSYKVISVNDSIDTWTGQDTTIYFRNYASFVVVATSDNTQIKFNLANSVYSNGTTYNANTDYYMTLNKGQTFCVTGIGLMGSTIESTNCKKIAVYSGNYCSNIPAACASCDLLVEQMPPINTWGKTFVIQSTLNRTNDSKIYVLGKDDNTQVSVKQNGITNVYTVNENEYIEFYSVPSGTLINSNKPIAVSQFSIGRQCTNRGDPLMMWINSTEQMVKEAIYAATPSVYVANHYILIFTKKGSATKTTLDGVNIGGSFVTFTPDPTYAYARITTTPTTHWLKNPDGFLANVYGYDNGAWLTQESYGYSLNFSFYNLQDYINILDNTEASSSLSYNTNATLNTYSVNDTVTINRNIQSNFISVSWLLNNKPYHVPAETNQPSFTWSFPASDMKNGENTLSMLIERSCMTDTIPTKLWLRSGNVSSVKTATVCAGDSIQLQATTDISNASYYWVHGTDTLSDHSATPKVAPTASSKYYVYAKYGNYESDKDSVFVTVLLASKRVIFDTICPSQTYSFEGTSINTTGLYEKHYTAANGCDSLIQLNLMVRPLVTYLTDSFCIGQTYIYRGKTLSAAGIYQDTITTISGCDSLIVFTLTYKKPIETLIRKKICEGDSYNFEGSIISTPGNYSHTYNATNGCDSLVTLVLETIPTQQTYIKAQINKGETYVFGTNSLTDSGIYADSLKGSLNCDSIIILNLTVVEDTTIFIPEGFSPNGDGVNDLFEIKNIDKYPNNHIWIFNRWGNLLFDGKPYLNNWDGKSKYAKMNGDDLPPTGTYFYILDLGDGSKPRKGYVWMQR